MLENAGGAARVEPLTSAGSHDIAAHARANALILVPAERRAPRRPEPQVECLLLEHTRGAAKTSARLEVHHNRRVRTTDGVSIAYTLWRRPSPEIVVLAPGFWRVRRARENLYLATHFVRRGYDVAALDFRGHGDSGGAYTFGPSETHDFHAVVEDLVGEGKPYSRFAVLGLSLGGSIAAEALARHPTPPCRALALISSPAHVSALRPRPWKPGAARQVRLRHVLRMPRIAGRRLLAPKPRSAGRWRS